MLVQTAYSRYNVTLLISSLLFFSMFDALATQAALSYGVLEANPIIDYMIDNWGFWSVYLLKLLPFTILFFATETLQQNVKLMYFLLFAAVVYFLLTLWHLFGLWSIM